MKKYIIPFELFSLRGRPTGEACGWCGRGRKPKEGEICLYDKNRDKYIWFTGAVKSPTHYGWIIKRGSIPRYFRQVIKEIRPQKKLTREHH